MQAAETGPSATGPSAAIGGTTATSSCQMPGGMFHVKHPRTATTPKHRDHNRRPPEWPRRWRSAARVRWPGVSQGFECPHPRTLQPSDRPDPPGAGRAHVSRETSPAINLRMRDIPNADGQNRIAGNEPSRSYRQDSGSTFLPDAGQNVSRETFPDRARAQNTGITTASRRNGPAAGSLPPRARRPGVSQGFKQPPPANTPTVRQDYPPGAGGAYVSRETSPTINLRMRDIPNVDGQNRIAGNEPFHNYRRDGGSIFLPDAGGMFHVKHPRTAPAPETPDHNRLPAKGPSSRKSATRARRPGVSQGFKQPPSANTPTVRQDYPPGVGEAQVSRETSPAINLRIRDIPNADGQNRIAGNEPSRSYQRDGGSTFLPDAAWNVSRETFPYRARAQNTGITTAPPECPRS